MSDLAFGLLLAALAAVTWWLARSRESRPLVLWVQGWAFLFASMAALLIGGEANLVTAGITQQAGSPISFSEFLKVGLPVTYLTLAAGFLWLLLRFVVAGG